MKKLSLILFFISCLTFASCTLEDGMEFLDGPAHSAKNMGLKVTGTINAISSTNQPENFTYVHEYTYSIPGYNTTRNDLSFNAQLGSTDASVGANAKDCTYGRMLFNASDTIQSPPTNYSFGLWPVYNDRSGNSFPFVVNITINETNSTISKYAINGDVITFTLTTNTGFKDASNKDANVMLDVILPFYVYQ